MDRYTRRERLENFEDVTYNGRKNILGRDLCDNQGIIVTTTSDSLSIVQQQAVEGKSANDIHNFTFKTKQAIALQFHKLKF